MFDIAHLTRVAYFGDNALRRAMGNHVASRGLGRQERPVARLGSCRSGQSGLTVNQLAYAFGGSNPPLPTIWREHACSHA